MKSAQTHNGKSHPRIVSREGGQRARTQLLVKEKAATRARDALAAERRHCRWSESRRITSSRVLIGKVSLQPSLSNAWTILGRWRERTLPAKGGS